jgi:hypothetical protein
MKKEHDEHLCKLYPKLFVNRNSSIMESCMSWGFEVGDGWFDLIELLCHSIQNHIDFHNRSRERDIEYNRMLEKYLLGDTEEFDHYHRNIGPEARAAMVRLGPKDVFEEIPQVVVDQVKEKFGSLRFYYSGGDEKIDGMVSMAEVMSSRICEHCGSPAKINNHNGWLSAICKVCLDRRNEKLGE